MVAPPPTGNEARSIRPLLEGAALVLALGVAFRIIAVVLDNPMTGHLVGAVLVSFLVDRAGVPLAKTPGHLRRAAIGASATALVVALAIAAGHLFGTRLGVVRPSFALAFGTAEAFAVAYRDEIWLHGLPLAYAARAGLTREAIPFAVIAPIATTALEPGATLAGLCGVAATSAFFVALWVRSRDGWAPIAAHFVWAWLVGALLAGELVELTGPGPWMHGPTSRGALAWLGVVGFAIAAAVVARRGLPKGAAAEVEGA